MRSGGGSTGELGQIDAEQALEELSVRFCAQDVEPSTSHSQTPIGLVT